MEGQGQPGNDRRHGPRIGQLVHTRAARYLHHFFDAERRSLALREFDRRQCEGPPGRCDTSRDGNLGYDELSAGTLAELPKGTEHGDLIAQLAARIALDAVDTDQGKSPVKSRTLSKGEWTNAAGEMAR